MQIIIRWWRCATNEDRKIMQIMGSAYGTLVPFMPRSVAETYFSIYGNAEERVNAFRDNLDIAEVTITPDEGDPFLAWYCNYEWVREVIAATDAGCLTLDDPSCQQMDFPSARDPECTYEDY